MTTQTISLDREIEQVEAELAKLRADLSDLDERGIYRVELDNGQTLEAEITGDELRLDPAALMQSLGVPAQADGNSPTGENVPAPLKKYLPYLLIAVGFMVLLLVLLTALGRSARPAATGVPVAKATPQPTAAATPTLTPTPALIPALIPADFIARAPILLSLPSLGLKWTVYKGDWDIKGATVTLAEGGDKIRYYNSFVGEGNTIMGGKGSTPADPFYAMRSADINDVVRVKDRAGRTFAFRLLPFGGDRVERWITPGDIWVAAPTDYIALTIIIRVGNRRMVLRGKLYAVDTND